MCLDIMVLKICKSSERAKSPAQGEALCTEIQSIRNFIAPEWAQPIYFVTPRKIKF
jgi:hypothetical protein